MLSQSVISVPAVWKLAEQIGKIQKPSKQNKSASSAEFGSPFGGGGGVKQNTVRSNVYVTNTVAITRAWLAHDTYNYRHTYM